MSSFDDDFDLISDDPKSIILHAPPSDPSPYLDPTKPRSRKDRADDLSDGSNSYNYGKRQNHSGTGAGEYRKDREEWSDTAISCLLDAYIEKLTLLNRGNLRGRDWEEVAIMVSERCENQTKTVEQCKNKVDNLKKRFKLETRRRSNGASCTTHWIWFDRMDKIVGNMSHTKVDPKFSSHAFTQAPIRPKSKYSMASTVPTVQINNSKIKSLTNHKWRRVIFRISGAALAGACHQNIDAKIAMLIAKEVAVACSLGVQVAIVVGGRNLFCGDSWVTETGFDRSTAYQISMMATVMNSVLLQSALDKHGVQTRVQASIPMQEVTEPYNRQRAIRHLEKGRVVIFGGVGAGAGNPLFSLDSAAALRASEINAEAIVKGTNSDEIYGCSTGNNTNMPFEHISFGEFVSRGVTSMDNMALTLCQDNGISVVVFNLLESGNISRALTGEQVGMLIDQTGRIS